MSDFNNFISASGSSEINMVLGSSLFNQVFLALFGGNTESITRGDERENEDRFDWWANSLLLSDRINKQMNSETEKTLSEISLNSEGRVNLQNSIAKDLSFIQNLVSLRIEVLFNVKNNVFIEIYIEDKKLQIEFDFAKKQIIDKKII